MEQLPAGERVRRHEVPREKRSRRRAHKALVNDVLAGRYDGGRGPRAARNGDGNFQRLPLRDRITGAV